MKSLKNIWLLAVCLAMVACDNSAIDIESCKDQYFEAWAKNIGTTKDFLLKDLDVFVDSIKIIPITVNDSVAILEEIGQVDSKQMREMKSMLAKMKRMEGLLALSSDKERVEEAKAFIREIPLEINSLEKAFKEDLPRYQGINGDKVLAYILDFQLATLDSSSGVHKVEKRRAVFSLNGKLEKFKCPMFLDAYLKHNLKLD